MHQLLPFGLSALIAMLTVVGAHAASGSSSYASSAAESVPTAPAGVNDQSLSEMPAGKVNPAAKAGAVKLARVRFLTPKNGATVPQEFTARFQVDGLKVKPAGEIEPGSGHFHIIINGEPAAEGEVIPADERHIHYGKGQTEAKLKLKPGQHTLTLQFADGAHRAYDSSLAETIKITVK